MIYVSIENRTTRHNAPCPGRIGAGQGIRGDAAIHLDDGIAPLPLQQTFGSSDLLVAAGQIDLPAATGVYRLQQQPRILGQVRQGLFHWRFGVEYQPGLHPGGADGPQGRFRPARDLVMDRDPLYPQFLQFRQKIQRLFHHQVNV